MKKLTLIALVFFLGLLGARGQTSCTDLNNYPIWKNTAGSGAYTLIWGHEEKAAQTYHYSSSGRVTAVRIYGYAPNCFTGVHLKVKLYHVDANGRPTTQMASSSTYWGWISNLVGYQDVSFFGGGVNVSSNFAVSVEIDGGFPCYADITQFRVGYNGDGEGLGQDLASLAGTSTGNNWVSAATNFSKDGDFYILPKMKNFICSHFHVSSTCLDAGDTIDFTNYTTMTTDSMFNTIGLSSYSGSDHFYTWDFGDGSPVSHATNPSHSYTTPGEYTISLTSTIDGWNNNCSDTYTKKISVGLAVDTSNVVNVDCHGDHSGSFTAVGSGGSTPYKYSLDGFHYHSNPNFSNLYAGTYTVYIKDNLHCIKTTTLTITEPPAIVFDTVATTNASCGNSDGGILASASGGTGSIQYSINHINWQSSGSFTGLHGGFYWVWAKDANGCQRFAAAIVKDLGGPSLTVSSYTNVSCHGGNDGSLILTATGGSGTHQYSVDGTNYQTSGTFPNLTAGTYYARVKDNAGCMDVKCVIIQEPPALSLTTEMTPVHCHGGDDGTITVTSAIGGTGTLSYSVDGATYQSSPNFAGLTAGTYIVFVKDVANCTATDTIDVTEPTALSASVVTTDAACNSSNDGSIEVTGSGGTSPYTYSLDGESYYPTGDFTSLLAGTYDVYVKDDNGCVYQTTATVGQPSVIKATVITGNSTCGNTNGNILITAAGGSGSGYQYSIDGVNFNSSGSFTGLADSTYIVIVRDGSGCEKAFSAIVSDSNGPVIGSASSTDITCQGGADGSITITSVSGGTGTLQYSVDGGPYQASTTFANLTAGIHTVLVKDANGCTGSYTDTLLEPAAIVVNTTHTNVTCFGGNDGTATITAGGGSGTLAYSVDGITFQSSNVFTGLHFGEYVATVRDAGGCTGSKAFVITQPTPINISALGILNVTCHGSGDGSINVTASGGTGTLTYSLDGISYQSSGLFSGLSGGTKTVYVKDASGCVSTATATVTEPAALGLSSTIHDVKCYGGNDGVITLSPAGGVAPYNYSWSDESSTKDVFNLTAGTYTVTMTDANGCTYSHSYTVSQPASPIIINGTVTNTSTSGSTDGAVNITVTGGTPPYTYLWSNSSTTEDLSNIGTGVYHVTVTDNNTCNTANTFVVDFATNIHENNGGSGPIAKLYPNPASKSVTLDVRGYKIQEVVMMNMIGKAVYSSTPGKSSVNIDLSKFAPGVYYIQYQIEGKEYHMRMSVVK